MSPHVSETRDTALNILRALPFVQGIKTRASEYSRLPVTGVPDPCHTGLAVSRYERPPAGGLNQVRRYQHILIQAIERIRYSHLYLPHHRQEPSPVHASASKRSTAEYFIGQATPAYDIYPPLLRLAVGSSMFA